MSVEYRIELWQTASGLHFLFYASLHQMVKIIFLPYKAMCVVSLLYDYFL